MLSKYISAMEKDLGVRLFERDRHHVTLTEAGAQFYLDMLKVINDYTQGLAHLRQLAGDGSFSLSVGYLRNASRPFLTTFLSWIEEKLPQAEVNVTSMEFGHLIQAQRSHKVDVIFTLRFDPEAESICDIVDVYRDKLYLIVSKDHPLAQLKGGVREEDLRGLEFVLPDPREYPGYGGFVRSLLPKDVPESSISHYNDIDTVILTHAHIDHVGGVERFKNARIFIQ